MGAIIFFLNENLTLCELPPAMIIKNCSEPPWCMGCIAHPHSSKLNPWQCPVSLLCPQPEGWSSFASAVTASFQSHRSSRVESEHRSVFVGVSYSWLGISYCIKQLRLAGCITRGPWPVSLTYWQSEGLGSCASVVTASFQSHGSPGLKLNAEVSVLVYPTHGWVNLTAQNS